MWSIALILNILCLLSLSSSTDDPPGEARPLRHNRRRHTRTPVSNMEDSHYTHAVFCIRI
jgi:hypothetical protein